MTFGQVKLHKCNECATSIKEIPVMYCYELTGDDGMKTVIAHDLMAFYTDSWSAQPYLSVI